MEPYDMVRRFHKNVKRKSMSVFSYPFYPSFIELFAGRAVNPTSATASSASAESAATSLAAILESLSITDTDHDARKGADNLLNFMEIY